MLLKNKSQSLKFVIHVLSTLWNQFRQNNSRLKIHKCSAQIRKQMSGPDLHVSTLKILALKNWFSPHKKYFPKLFSLVFIFILCNFSVQTLKYFQKNLEFNFLSIKTLKNGPQKLLIIGPDPFISQSAQATPHSPELIFPIMNSRDQTSVLLSVVQCLYMFT